LQLNAACEFLLASTVSAVDEEEFKKACGVGVEVSIDEIEDAVSRGENELCILIG